MLCGAYGCLCGVNPSCLFVGRLWLWCSVGLECEYEPKIDFPCVLTIGLRSARIKSASDLVRESDVAIMSLVVLVLGVFFSLLSAVSLFWGGFFGG